MRFIPPRCESLGGRIAGMLLAGVQRPAVPNATEAVSR
jgi:hypothetical protein